MTVDSSDGRLGVVVATFAREGGNELHFMLDAMLTLPHVGTGFTAAEASWIGQRCGDEGAFRARQFGGSLTEMLSGHGIDAIDALPHFNGIKVDFHDALLRPDELDKNGEVGFESLAQPGTARPEEDVLCRLLTDGAATEGIVATFHVTLGSFLNGVVVESVVQQEPLVLAGHDSYRHVLRYFLH